MNNWDQAERKIFKGYNHLCIYKELSNGQVLGVFICKFSPTSHNFAITIRDSVLECDQWVTVNDTSITGKCGLEGLILAFRVLKWFIKENLPEGDTIRVHGFGRRGKIYNYLTRIGFKPVFQGQEESMYEYKN